MKPAIPTFQTLLVQAIEPGIVLCTFNRPEKRNALNAEMVSEIRTLLQILREREMRVLIFTGSGEKAFISGADIGELKQRDRFSALCQINTRLFREIEEWDHPTIAAIRGYALGGGLELAMACDLRIAGEGAQVGQPEAALGILPAAGGCYRLSRLIGMGKAKELVYTGKRITAAQALEMGLINRVVPDAEVVNEARKLAREIIANSKPALSFAKAVFNATENAPIAFGMELESAAQGILFEDPEKDQRMQDFLEKKGRKP